MKVYQKGLRPQNLAGDGGVILGGEIAAITSGRKRFSDRLQTFGSIVKEHMRLLRPHQWVKNGFVLIPAVFAGKIGVLVSSYRPAVAFISFSLAASSVYVLNDILDIERDRIHERKRFRPLASGAVSVRTAIIMLGLLLSLAAIAGYAVGTTFLLIVAGYFALNVAYSFHFKHVSIIDISFIASGFVLRVLAGGEAAGVVISKWLILMTFLLACCLAIGKRRDDLLMGADKTSLRPANSGYTLRFVDTCLVILASITIVCYVMYTVSEEVVHRLNSDNVYLTSVFVIIGILRFLQIAIVEQKSGSPTRILLKDTLIQSMIGLWFVSFLILIYVSK